MHNDEQLIKAGLKIETERKNFLIRLNRVIRKSYALLLVEADSLIKGARTMSTQPQPDFHNDPFARATLKICTAINEEKLTHLQIVSLCVSILFTKYRERYPETYTQQSELKKFVGFLNFMMEEMQAKMEAKS